VRDLRNCNTQSIWELDILVSRLLELILPELAILDPLFQIRIREEEFAIEPAGAFRDSWVQLVKMIRAADHQDAVVGLQAVNFVEEERTHAFSDKGVEVFEDEVTRRFLAGFAEDLRESELGRDETIGSDEVNSMLRLANRTRS
jgi:hypothetical protein